MSGSDSLILMAELGAAHGLRGELRAQIYAEDPLGLTRFNPFQTDTGKSIFIARVKRVGERYVVSLKGVCDRNAADEMRGTLLYVDRARLPDVEEEDEFYLNDLIGLEAVDSDGETLGEVIAVPNFGADDLVEVAPILDGKLRRGKSWFVAFTRENVPDIDIANGRLVVVRPVEVSERDE
ncbi:MAG: ribosome maturation factor RimM [Pseudomonadota bacterium]